MRFALLLCVLLFAVSISVDARRVKIHKKRTVQPISDALIDLKSTNSVLYNEVLALLEAGGPVDDILNLFYALRNDLLAEQQTAQEAHDRAKVKKK